MSEQGKCPKCGENLQYDGHDVRTDDGHAERVRCPECGWQGYEEYRETFAGHSDPEPAGYVVLPPPAETSEAARDGTRCYRVVYEIDVMAHDPQAAARQVDEIFRDPSATPPMFTVLDSDGTRIDVDLMEILREESQELMPPPDESSTPPTTPA